MDYKRLKKLHQDREGMEELQKFMTEMLRKEAADKAVEGESTEHIKDAHTVLNDIFRELDYQFGEKTRHKTKNPSF